MLVPEAKRKKLDDKARICRFLGYTNNGYIVEDTEDGKLHYSRNVTFKEEVYQRQVYLDEDLESDDDSDKSEVNESETKELEHPKAVSGGPQGPSRLPRPVRHARRGNMNEEVMERKSRVHALNGPGGVFR
jgi:hypothetical protein